MSHPYQNVPEFALWPKAVGRVALEEVDPVVNTKLAIGPTMRVATAGSCFAQHISRCLKREGFNFYVSELAHDCLPESLQATFNYGVYTARYGNVYTSRQLVQLFDRAYGVFSPQEIAWKHNDGYYVDPFRPRIQPRGYDSIEEVVADRRQHLRYVRQAFEGLEVLVLTLGLTECWADRRDGAVFPLCPGVSGGSFDPDKHTFVNLTIHEVVSDLMLFAGKLRAVNSDARILLTVSPIPLMATAMPDHVLVATAHSKAVLRVAATEICRLCDQASYFPAYEIITGTHARGRYFSTDLRTVSDAGIDHVMRVFLKHYTVPASSREESSIPKFDLTKTMERIAAVACEEAVLCEHTGSKV